MLFYEFLRERVFLRDENGVYPLWYVILYSYTLKHNYCELYITVH